jgi:hypothetical protein
LIAIAALLLIPIAASAAMAIKEPRNVSAMRKVVPAWNAVDRLPNGARVAWFSNVEPYKYYRAFGPGLIHVPVVVGSEGDRFVFLHENWRNSHPTWFRRGRGKGGGGGHQWSRLVPNLLAQHVDFVFVMRGHGGGWPAQYSVLDSAKNVTAVVKRGTFAVFKLPKGRHK